MAYSLHLQLYRVQYQTLKPGSRRDYHLRPCGTWPQVSLPETATTFGNHRLTTCLFVRDRHASRALLESDDGVVPGSRGELAGLHDCAAGVSGR